MADESDIRGYLVANAGVTALVSTRIYDQRVPDNLGQPPVRPFVVMTTVADVDQTQIQGPQIAGLFTIQFDIYADTKASAKAVLTAMRAVLHPYGTESVARDLPADDPQLRRISCDWQFLMPR